MNKLLLILLVSFFSYNAQAQTTVPVKVYPNPATVSINFEAAKPLPNGCILAIYNFIGKKIAENKNISTKTTMPITELSRGVYIYVIYDATGKTVLANGKFQVSR